MRKALIFLIGFVLLGTLGMAYAQTAEDNFQKAAQTELVKREIILSEKKAEIEKFFFSMADDAIVSGEKEMQSLLEMVKHFDKTKTRLDKELEFYNVSTRVKILPTIREHLKIYFVWNKEQDKDASKLYFRDNNEQEIRKFWVERTGRDIKIEKYRNLEVIFASGLLLALMMGFGVFGITGLFAFSLNDSLQIGFLVFLLIFFILVLWIVVII